MFTGRDIPTYISYITLKNLGMESTVRFLLIFCAGLNVSNGDEATRVVWLLPTITNVCQNETSIHYYSCRSLTFHSLRTVFLHNRPIVPGLELQLT